MRIGFRLVFKLVILLVFIILKFSFKVLVNSFLFEYIMLNMLIELVSVVGLVKMWFVV